MIRITFGEASTFTIGLLFGFVTATNGWMGFFLSLSAASGGIAAATWAHERIKKNG